MMSDEMWHPLPTAFALAHDEVHVWKVVLDRPAGEVTELQRLLSADEQARAERFYFERDQRKFIVTRAVLRLLIGRYLDITPAKVQFEYQEHGKPALARTTALGDFQFNISHSGEMALLAFTYGRPIGVDIEYSRPLDDAERVAKRSFSPGEFEVFRRLPTGQKQEAFFNCWTRKEAFIKAIGEGLSHPLDQFDVAFAPGEKPGFLYIAGDEQAAGHWSLKALQPAPSYIAALAVKGKDWQLTCWEWPRLLPIWILE
jgi:4'-phosphopantetheinyl transferase